MSDLYVTSAASALSLLQRLGKTLTLTRDGGGTFDPALGKYTSTASDTTASVSGVILPVTKVEDNSLLADLIQGRLRRIIIAASGLTFEPRARDKITDGSTNLEVLGSTPINPAGTPIIHRILARVIG